jgi:hypothetical protein
MQPKILSKNNVGKAAFLPHSLRREKTCLQEQDKRAETYFHPLIFLRAGVLCMCIEKNVSLQKITVSYLNEITYIKVIYDTARHIEMEICSAISNGCIGKVGFGDSTGD